MSMKIGQHAPQSDTASQKEDASKMKQIGKEPKARRKLAIAETVKPKDRHLAHPEAAPLREEAVAQELLPVLSQPAIMKGLERHVSQLRNQILDPAGGSDRPIPIRPSLQKVRFSIGCL